MKLVSTLHTDQLSTAGDERIIGLGNYIYKFMGYQEP
jgi:hypothetical protein